MNNSEDTSNEEEKVELAEEVNSKLQIVEEFDIDEFMERQRREEEELKNKVIRNTVEEPPCIFNAFCACLYIVNLQIIMWSPYLLDMLRRKNECRQITCNVFNEINSYQTFQPNTIPRNIPHNYLKHEVLTMMGLHKPYREFLTSTYKASFGSKCGEKRIDDQSYCLFNFFRLLMMDKRRTATLNDLLRLSTNQTELERNRKNEKCVTALKKLGKRIDFAKEAGDQEKFLLGNDLVSRDTNIWITLVAHLFLDPLDRNGEFIGIVMYPDMETEYIRTETEYFPMVPPQLIDVMVHIPPLKLLIVQFGTEIVEEKYYDISKSFLEYMDSIQSRTFNERVGKDLYWIREKAAEVIHRYGYPKVVITPERSVDGNVNAVQLSVETHMGLTRRIMDAIRRVRAEPLITLEQLQNHHPLTPLRDLLFSRYSPRLSAHYWNDDGFSKMRLFRNFINDKEGDNYLLFALQLEIDTQHYRMIPKTSLPELCEKEIEYFNRTFLRTIDYLRDITHYEESLPNNEIIVNYVKSILKSPIEYETLANVDKFHQMRYLQRQIPFTPHFDTERPRYRPGHAMVMIRTFNNNWHVVDNDHIYRVERPWFFLQTDNGFSDIANMYWHEERSYDLKEDLKQYMKPIISKDYDHKDGMMLYH